jgi:hypothetical protein
VTIDKIYGFKREGVGSKIFRGILGMKVENGEKKIDPKGVIIGERVRS